VTGWTAPGGYPAREDGRPPTWLYAAACAGHPEPDLWFQDRQHPAGEALEICAGCPVRLPCVQAALLVSAINDHGIRGGLTPVQRRPLRRLDGAVTLADLDRAVDGWPVADVNRHGTYDAYTQRGCRCPVCQEAQGPRSHRRQDAS
jgi:hypothetical protein